MFIPKKRIILTIGIGCILWSYYQLFVVDMERSFINKQVAALTEQGEVTGKVIGIKTRAIVISDNNKTIEVPKHSIIKVEDLMVDVHETRRVLLAVSISVLGGILVWIALFFL